MSYLGRIRHTAAASGARRASKDELKARAVHNASAACIGAGFYGLPSDLHNAAMAGTLSAAALLAPATVSSMDSATRSVVRKAEAANAKASMPSLRSVVVTNTSIGLLASIIYDKVCARLPPGANVTTADSFILEAVGEEFLFALPGQPPLDGHQINCYIREALARGYGPETALARETSSTSFRKAGSLMAREGVKNTIGATHIAAPEAIAALGGHLSVTASTRYNRADPATLGDAIEAATLFRERALALTTSTNPLSANGTFATALSSAMPVSGTLRDACTVAGGTTSRGKAPVAPSVVSYLLNGGFDCFVAPLRHLLEFFVKATVDWQPRVTDLLSFYVKDFYDVQRRVFYSSVSYDIGKRMGSEDTVSKDLYNAALVSESGRAAYLAFCDSVAQKNAAKATLREAALDRICGTTVGGAATRPVNATTVFTAGITGAGVNTTSGVTGTFGGSGSGIAAGTGTPHTGTAPRTTLPSGVGGGAPAFSGGAATRAPGAPGGGGGGDGGAGGGGGGGEGPLGAGAGPPGGPPAYTDAVFLMPPRYTPGTTATFFTPLDTDGLVAPVTDPALQPFECGMYLEYNHVFEDGREEMRTARNRCLFLSFWHSAAAAGRVRPGSLAAAYERFRRYMATDAYAHLTLNAFRRLAGGNGGMADVDLMPILRHIFPGRDFYAEPFDLAAARRYNTFILDNYNVLWGPVEAALLTVYFGAGLAVRDNLGTDAYYFEPNALTPRPPATILHLGNHYVPMLPVEYIAGNRVAINAYHRRLYNDDLPRIRGFSATAGPRGAGAQATPSGGASANAATGAPSSGAAASGSPSAGAGAVPGSGLSASTGSGTVNNTGTGTAPGETFRPAGMATTAAPSNSTITGSRFTATDVRQHMAAGNTSEKVLREFRDAQRSNEIAVKRAKARGTMAFDAIAGGSVMSTALLGMTMEGSQVKIPWSSSEVYFIVDLYVRLFGPIPRPRYGWAARLRDAVLADKGSPILSHRLNGKYGFNIAIKDKFDLLGIKGMTSPQILALLDELRTAHAKTVKFTAAMDREVDKRVKAADAQAANPLPPKPDFSGGVAARARAGFSPAAHGAVAGGAATFTTPPPAPRPIPAPYDPHLNPAYPQYSLPYTHYYPQQQQPADAQHFRSPPPPQAFPLQPPQGYYINPTSTMPGSDAYGSPPLQHYAQQPNFGGQLAAQMPFHPYFDLSRLGAGRK